MWLPAERRLSNGEIILALVGSMALLVASVLSICSDIYVLPVLKITKPFFILAVVVFFIEIRNELVRKHFILSHKANPTFKPTRLLRAAYFIR